MAVDDPAFAVGGGRSVGITHPANLLTSTRLVFAPLLFWMVIDAEAERGASWPAFGLGFVLACTDFFDGRVARRANAVSRRGAFLDPLADKVLVLGAAVCLVWVQRYWWLPVAIIAVRELGITAWRARWATQGIAIPARRSAKYKTTVQGAALLMAVMPTLESQDAAVAVALWVAVAWTVVSGLQYMRDARSVAQASAADAGSAPGGDR